MKANELMIGDKLKTVFSQKVVKVKEIKQSCIYTEDNGYEYNEIEPIPLTPEILEKNGWIKDGYFYKAEDGSYIQLGELFEHASFRAEKHGIPREIQTSPHLLKYVHQLQHALRLCGIEKEIIL